MRQIQITKAERAARHARLVQRRAAIRAQIEWGQAHPYAGACGDDDRLADLLAEIDAQLTAL